MLVHGEPHENLTLAPSAQSDFYSDSHRAIGPQKSERAARDGVFYQFVNRRSGAREFQLNSIPYTLPWQRCWGVLRANCQAPRQLFPTGRRSYE